jgi:hypothetical protein
MAGHSARCRTAEHVQEIDMNHALRRLLTVAGLVAVCSASLAADIAGYVLEVQGHWVRSNGSSASVGMPLPPGETLSIAAAHAGDRIVVVDARTAAVLAVRECNGSRNCQPLTVPAAKGAAAAKSIDALLGRLMARLGVDPDRYVATISRGSAPLPSTMLPLVDGVVDLEPWVGTLKEGTELRLMRLSCGADTRCAAEAHEARIGPAGSVRVEGMAPGLYELVMRQVPGTPGPQRIRGWVLLAERRVHAQALVELEALRARVDGWGGQVASVTGDGIIRAWLEQRAAF